jgi:hypothetical protein
VGAMSRMLEHVADVLEKGVPEPRSPKMSDADKKSVSFAWRCLVFVCVMMMGAVAGVATPKAYEDTQKWLNAPPPPVTDMGRAVIESLKTEKGWKLHPSGGGIYHEKAGVYLDCIGQWSYTVYSLDWVKNKNTDTSAPVYGFAPQDKVAILEVAKPLHEKLTTTRFVDADEKEHFVGIRTK